MTLNREQILKANDTVTVTVPVPEWGGDVTVRGLTGKERDEFEQSLIVMAGSNITMTMSNARAHLVALGTVDENGQRLFTLADVEALGAKNAAPLDRIADAVRELSGLGPVSAKQINANFTVTRSDVSTSN